MGYRRPSRVAAEREEHRRLLTPRWQIQVHDCGVCVRCKGFLGRLAWIQPRGVKYWEQDALCAKCAVETKVATSPAPPTPAVCPCESCVSMRAARGWTQPG